MTAEAQGGQRRRRRLGLIAAGTVAVVLAVVVVPPLVSVSRYKSQITRLISSSLGRPVRLSSVELRLLPRPGFVLSDLSVAEDPEYGAEPVLHANTVTASIRLLSLWRGRLEIGRISVDEASLNLVRSGPGKWNLDSLFRTAAQRAGSTANAGGAHRAVALPYLEATNSRINIKDGAEKLPFSLINTDISFWQDNPGDWRIQLRGQPARTDVSLSEEDTGIVRLQASVRRADALRAMPVHLDLDWREAQLGQLARLIVGWDPGWRGDLTGELHLDGTADAAQIRTRLRATGVHRAEFSPAEPLDFDANCNLVYHYSRHAVEGLVCDSPLGDGRIHLTGEMPDVAGPPRAAVELDRIPVAAGLAVLRALRSGLEPGLEAKGTVNGKMVYAPAGAPGGEPKKPATRVRGRQAKTVEDQGPLAGTLTVDGFELSGAGLSRPLQAAKVVLEPVTVSSADGEEREALAGSVNIPVGGAIPLTVSFRLVRSGYQVTLRGQSGLARARELVHAAGMADVSGLDGLAGDPISVDLSGEGPWLAGKTTVNAVASPGAAGQSEAAAAEAGDSLSGTVTVRNANWTAEYMAGHVEISQATLHLGGGGIRWDPVVFSYGPLKGSASVALPAKCEGPADCKPQFEVQFGNLDAAVVQTAILGVREKGTLLSNWIDRIHPSSSPPWPGIEGTVKADSVVLGPVTLKGPSAKVSIDASGAEITDLDAEVLGGRVTGSGTLMKAENDKGRPAYELEGQFKGLKANDLGVLLGMRWEGRGFNGDGKIALSGYTASELAGSAKGTLHFEWRNGAVGRQPSASSKAGPVPAALGRFDRWSGEAAIGNGAITLGQNEVKLGGRGQAVEGTLTFGDPVKVSLKQ